MADDRLAAKGARAAGGGSRPLAVEPIDEYVESQMSEPGSKALAALSPDQRQVVVLADIEELSYQEIAEIAGCSIGTVRSRLHRARHQLRKLIEKYSASTK